MSEPLVCPSCATTHPLDERFCPDCGMPLTYSAAQSIDEPVTDLHSRLRKVKKQYAEGRLVHAVGSRNQAEAEFIQGLLLEEGVPSLLRRTRGFDVPEMMAAGPRDVLVPESGLMTAREVLLEADLLPEPRAPDEPKRILAGLLAAVLVVAAIAWAGTELLA